MLHKNVVRLEHQEKSLRVVIDRQEPAFLVDDLVSLADIEDKASAIEEALKNDRAYGPMQFDQIILHDALGRETLHDVTDRAGAVALVEISGRFGFHEPDEKNMRILHINFFRDWVFNAATYLIDVEWALRVNEHEMKQKLKEKDRELDELKRKVKWFVREASKWVGGSVAPAEAQTS
jgi:hypothetical protein